LAPKLTVVRPSLENEVSGVPLVLKRATRNRVWPPTTAQPAATTLPSLARPAMQRGPSSDAHWRFGAPPLAGVGLANHQSTVSQRSARLGIDQ
jgi:hypothetical protein